MKTITLTLSAALLALSTFAGNGEGENSKSLKVDPEKSKVFWTGKKVTGEHTGTLMVKSGFVELDNHVPTKVRIVMDMNSIVCTDLKDPGTNAKFVGHLKSDDFFSVSAHPEGIFEATTFTPIEGATGRNPNYEVKGTLTLKGIDHEVAFEAYILAKGGSVVSNGSAVFDRTHYDIKFRSGSVFDNLGDKMIYDDVELTFVLSAGV